jgi:hypothetical protein
MYSARSMTAHSWGSSRVLKTFLLRRGYRRMPSLGRSRNNVVPTTHLNNQNARYPCRGQFLRQHHGPQVACPLTEPKQHTPNLLRRFYPLRNGNPLRTPIFSDVLGPRPIRWPEQDRQGRSRATLCGSTASWTTRTSNVADIGCAPARGSLITSQADEVWFQHLATAYRQPTNAIGPSRSSLRPNRFATHARRLPGAMTESGDWSASYTTFGMGHKACPRPNVRTQNRRMLRSTEVMFREPLVRTKSWCNPNQTRTVLPKRTRTGVCSCSGCCTGRTGFRCCSIS